MDHRARFAIAAKNLFCVFLINQSGRAALPLDVRKGFTFPFHAHIKA